VKREESDDELMLEIKEGGDGVVDIGGDFDW
jgi:hypothetical protein